MTENDKLQMFEDRPIRTAWDETQEEWYFSIVDVVTVLTESGDYNTGRKYWNKLKQRLKAEGSELVTNCHQLKMKATDGKRRLTDVANTEQLLRIIQSVPSKKAEPFKMWLAMVGRERIEEMKKRYYDARHNCWCYIIKDGPVRYSDDGEPQGTAGQPMLNVFQREEVTNVCCVVTRYFGGILLGAGGLTRAYTKGAKDALDAVGISTMSLWTLWDVPCTYPLFERVKLEIVAADGILDDMDYGADVTLTVSLPSERRETLQGRLTELSAGGLTLALMEESYRPGPREEL